MINYVMFRWGPCGRSYFYRPIQNGDVTLSFYFQSSVSLISFSIFFSFDEII